MNRAWMLIGMIVMVCFAATQLGAAEIEVSAPTQVVDDYLAMKELVLHKDSLIRTDIEVDTSKIDETIRSLSNDMRGGLFRKLDALYVFSTVRFNIFNAAYQSYADEYDMLKDSTNDRDVQRRDVVFENMQYLEVKRNSIAQEVSNIEQKLMSEYWTSRYQTLCRELERVPKTDFKKRTEIVRDMLVIAVDVTEYLGCPDRMQARVAQKLSDTERLLQTYASWDASQKNSAPMPVNEKDRVLKVPYSSNKTAEMGGRRNYIKIVTDRKNYPRLTNFKNKTHVYELYEHVTLTKRQHLKKNIIERKRDRLMQEEERQLQEAYAADNER